MKTRMSVCVTVMLVLVAMPFSGAWGGQSLARNDQPGTSLPVTENAPFDVREVVTPTHNQMRSEGNAHVTENAHYRAEFLASGLRYLPKENGVLVGAHAFAFYLSEIQIGEQSRLMSATRPAILQGNRVEYTHDQGIVEAYLGLDAGIEQLFVLKDPLPPGNLTLVGRVETRLVPQEDVSGDLRFLSEGREVLRYGKAVAFDAAGTSTRIVTRLLPNSEPGMYNLELTMPGNWLANAVYPVTVDPLIGGNFSISLAAEHQYNPAVAYNDDDQQWLVVWHDGRNGTNYGIYGQRVDRNGTLLGFGAPITIWDDASSLQNPAVAYDTTQHRYLVVWQNVTSPAIEGRIINADGTFFTSRFSITTGTKARTNPDVAYNPVTDEYLVVWQYAETTGGDIWARKVSTEGVVDPGGTYTISTETADERYPAVKAYLGDGRYLVVWSSDRTGSFNVVGRRLLSDGSVTGSLFGISTGSGQEYSPDLAFSTGSGQALVVWVDFTQGALRGRQVSSTNTLGTEFLVSSPANSSLNTAIAFSPTDQKYLVMWSFLWNVYGQWIYANGSIEGSPFVICPEWGGNVALAFGPERFLATWMDDRNSTWDIYGQIVSYHGSVIYLPFIRR